MNVDEMFLVGHMLAPSSGRVPPTPLPRNPSGLWVGSDKQEASAASKGILSGLGPEPDQFLHLHMLLFCCSDQMFVSHEDL